jgi:hypothetical protein
VLTRDKRPVGRANIPAESAVDLARLRRDRLRNVQREMAARQIGALVLTDIVNIRYCTGVAVMPLWTAVNIAHYIVVPVEGDPVIFEYGGAEFRARAWWPDVRPSMFWQARVTDADSPGKAAAWARQIKDVLEEKGLADARVGIDVLDYNGFTALQALGIQLTDSDRTMSAARIIKLPAEIELMRQSCAIAEAALHDMEQAIRPGISENELLAIFWHRVLALGGEHCFTRLIVSGYKTNPWFHEADGKLVEPGDLVVCVRHFPHLPVRREGECGPEGSLQRGPRLCARLHGVDQAGTGFFRFRRAVSAVAAGVSRAGVRRDCAWHRHGRRIAERAAAGRSLYGDARRRIPGEHGCGRRMLRWKGRRAGRRQA